MQAGVQALREELERERARHAEAEQTERRQHRDVVNEFEKTIQEIRGQMEVTRAKK
jgi:coenzyme F420-reducing hydrogenase delta subunit